MAVDTIAGLKAKMPQGTPGGTTVADLYDVLDTFEDRTTQDVVTKTGAYTAALADNRRKFLFTNATAVNFTLPTNLPAGWECAFVQMGVGQVTVVIASGAGAVLSRANHTRAAGQYAQCYLFVASNAGAAPQVLLGGDTA
jgi:hypothetical protein